MASKIYWSVDDICKTYSLSTKTVYRRIQDCKDDDKQSLINGDSRSGYMLHVDFITTYITKETPLKTSSNPSNNPSNEITDNKTIEYQQKMIDDYRGQINRLSDWIDNRDKATDELREQLKRLTNIHQHTLLKIDKLEEEVRYLASGNISSGPIVKDDDGNNLITIATTQKSNYKPIEQLILQWIDKGWFVDGDDSGKSIRGSSIALSKQTKYKDSSIRRSYTLLKRYGVIGDMSLNPLEKHIISIWDELKDVYDVQNDMIKYIHDTHKSKIDTHYTFKSIENTLSALKRFKIIE